MPVGLGDKMAPIYVYMSVCIVCNVVHVYVCNVVHVYVCTDAIFGRINVIKRAIELLGHGKIVRAVDFDLEVCIINSFVKL